MKSFLIERCNIAQSGAYTVIPVYHQKLLDIPFHANRLSTSFSGLTGYPSNVKYVTKCYLQNLSKLDNVHNGYVLTAIWKTKTTNDPVMDSYYLSANDMFNSLSHDFKIEFQYYNRKSPEFKDMMWPNERLFMEEKKKKSTSEVIMISKMYKCILEGLTSNIFFVNSHERKLYTCLNGDVLNGSMGRLVEATCKQLNIPVIHQNIHLNDIGTIYTSAFLTSATKPIQIVSSCTFNLNDDDDDIRAHDNEKSTIDSIQLNTNNELINTIKYHLLKHLTEQNSDSLYPYIAYPLWWEYPTKPISSKDTNIYSDQIITYINMI